MPGPLAGPGQGLPYPQNLYPSLLNNAPVDPSANQVALSPGETMVLPAGDFYISLGMYLVLQFLDPVTGTWMFGTGDAYNRGMTFVKSDGFTVRIANLTGCVVGAAVTAVGTNYVQATTTITAVGTFNNGAPTFVPIVGGQLGTTGTFTIDVPTKGAGYGVAPIIAIPPPPPANANPNGVGGIQAAAVAILGTGGSIASISMVNAGAGYPSVPTAVVVTSPFDPNINAGITVASVSFSLTGTGAITGVLVTDHGSPLNNNSLSSVTLTVGGAGSTATLSAIVMQTIISGSITGAGAPAGAAFITTYGGVPAAGGIVNPYSLGQSWIPRPANISTPSLTANQPFTIYDGGLFLGTPTAVLNQSQIGLNTSVTIATITVNMGSRQDIAVIQPAP